MRDNERMKQMTVGKEVVETVQQYFRSSDLEVVLKERTNGRTDGRTDPLIETERRIKIEFEKSKKGAARRKGKKNLYIKDDIELPDIY